MLDISRVRARVPQFRGQADVYEPAPEPSAPPASPPRTRRHTRRIAYRWVRLFEKVYKIYEQRRLVAVLGDHIQRYNSLGWERWSGEPVANRLYIVLQCLVELRGLFSSLVQLIDRVRSATSLCEKLYSVCVGFWKLRSFFGYAAAGAWCYKGAVVIFSSEEEDLVVDTPRAPSEAPRPLLLE